MSCVSKIITDHGVFEFVNDEANRKKLVLQEISRDSSVEKIYNILEKAGVSIELSCTLSVMEDNSSTINQTLGDKDLDNFFVD